MNVLILGGTLLELKILTSKNCFVPTSVSIRELGYLGLRQGKKLQENLFTRSNGLARAADPNIIGKRN